MTYTRLIIARHGNTFEAGEEPRRVGVTDLPLVEAGMQQAERLARALMAQEMLPDRIITSQLQRTKQMAQVLKQVVGKEIPTSENPLFNEIDYGVDENQCESAVVARLGTEALRLWEEEALLPQGWNSNPQAVMQGWQAVADEILQQEAGSTVMVITSNGIARFAPVLLTGGIEAFRLQHPLKLATGAYGVFAYEKGSTAWHCLSWNVRE